MIAAAWLGAPQLAARGIEPIYAMAGGVMLGGVLQLGVQLPVLLRMGLLPRIGLRWAEIRAAWAHPGVRRILKLMAPALLGVGVAQVSLMINTQIASYLAPGSVTWLFYADRLMEFPTALLGVALGVVLTPQLAAARAAGDAQRYSAMLDWGLRLVVLLAVPCAVALLTFATPLVATLFHHGALHDGDVGQIARALVGYGAGLLGLVAIKVLAPGYYASQDIRTPVRIAVVVLVITQLLNVALVPLLAQCGAGLVVSGLGASRECAVAARGLAAARQLPTAAGLGAFCVAGGGGQRLVGRACVVVGRRSPTFPWLARARRRPAARGAAGRDPVCGGGGVFRRAVGRGAAAAAAAAALMV